MLDIWRTVYTHDLEARRRRELRWARTPRIASRSSGGDDVRARARARSLDASVAVVDAALDSTPPSLNSLSSLYVRIRFFFFIFFLSSSATLYNIIRTPSDAYIFIYLLIFHTIIFSLYRDALYTVTRLSGPSSLTILPHRPYILTRTPECVWVCVFFPMYSRQNFPSSR